MMTKSAKTNSPFNSSLLSPRPVFLIDHIFIFFYISIHLFSFKLFFYEELHAPLSDIYHKFPMKKMSQKEVKDIPM